MKKLIYFLALLVSFSTASSQKVYFVYLQTESAQPFYLKLNEKTYSSSASGYLILSKLSDSTYKFSVGFPQNKWPEQRFAINMNGKDRGYLLKNFEDGSWGLFDLQTLTIQIAPANAQTGSTEFKKVSVFTDILSRAANDPSLREIPVKVKAEDESLAVQPAVLKEQLVNQKPVVTNELSSKTIITSNYKRSVVTKKSESSTTEGFGLVFIDEYGDGKRDTISIIIPGSFKNVSNDKPKETKKLLDLETKPYSDTAGNTKLTISDCSTVASENDFFELKRIIASEATNDGKIGQAKKYFNAKCFTVLQVKSMGAIFLNDAEKYKFYDAASAHIADIENFQSLQSELKDEYYISRFNTILK